MIRSELVEQLLQANPGLTRRQAERIVAWLEGELDYSI